MNRNEDLRGVFGALHAEGDPELGFTAGDIVVAGQRVRRRRRALAIAGSGLATAGVVVAVVLLSGGRADEPVGPAEPTGPTTTVGPTIDVPSTTGAVTTPLETTG